MQTYRYELPLPPSVNHYWRLGGGHFYVAKAGREFRKAVAAIVGPEPPRCKGVISILAVVTYPDRRRRDIDNFLKSTLDCLAYAGVYEDDSQIEEIHLKKAAMIQKPGSLFIEVHHFGE